jgi:hypothetical protein
MPPRQHREVADYLGRVIQDEMNAGRGAGAVDRVMTAIRDWGDWFDVKTPKFFQEWFPSVLRGDPVGKKGAIKNPAPTVRPGQEWREDRRAIGTAEETRKMLDAQTVKPTERYIPTEADLEDWQAKPDPEALEKMRLERLAKDGPTPEQIRVTPNAKITPTIGETSGGFKSIADIAQGLGGIS